MNVVFENDGVLDQRLIRTFGISIKENQNPIGFFGTGLKYAVSILIRNDQKFKIFAGETELVFEKQSMTVRNQEVETIAMNGEALPFTTRLGINWDMWQAFREVWCNTMDEGGSVYLSETMPKPQPDKTIFVATGGDFVDIYHERDKIILALNDEMKIHDGAVQIFNKPSKSLFYRGIRVYDYDRMAKYTYNIVEHIELTEDRTVKYLAMAINQLPKAVAAMKQKGTIRNVITAPEGIMESTLNFNQLKYYGEVVGDEFMEVLGEEYNSNSDNLNESARDFFIFKKNKSAAKNYAEEPMNTIERAQLRKAVAVCRTLFSDFDNYKILVTKHLGSNTVALADASMNTMVLSKDCFVLGTKFVVSTLIEEYTHLKYGYDDCTRAMQNHLFNTIADIAETHVMREPI